MTPRPTVQPPRISAAEERLAQSRAQITRWLVQDEQAAAAPTALNSLLQGALPLLTGLRSSAGAAVLVGSLAQAWARSAPPQPGPAEPPSPLDLAMGMVRRHPKATLATAGLLGLALFWWSGSSDRKPPVRT